MISRKIKKNVGIMALMVLLFTSSAGLLYSFPHAEATKTRNCSTNPTATGIDAVAPTETWSANAGGTLQKFTNLAIDCTNTSYTVGSDDHFIDRSFTTQVEFTQHTNNKVTYYDPTTGTTIDCTGSSFNGADDIASYTGSAQYSTAYSAGTVVKTVKGSTTCTSTVYTVPGTSPNPEGIAKSTNVNGFFVVDENNKKLYSMSQTGVFTLCKDFNTISGAPRPWFTAVSDSNSLVWVTSNIEKTVRALGTSSCLVAETSPTGPGNAFDIAMAGDNVDVYVSFNNNAQVARYKTSTHSWSASDDWNTECPSCTGFGISSIISTNTYYAAMQGSPSKIVVGSIS